MKPVVFGAVAVALLAGTALTVPSASAQQRYDRSYDYERYDRSYDRYDRDDGYDRGERRGDRFERNRGDFREGGIVPYNLRVGGHYVHEDWRGSGLRRPPRGTSWLKIGNDFILANNQTGRILEIENARGRPAVWTEGGVVPYEFRVGGKYVHHDWRGAGLPPPRNGQAWLHLGDAFVLADTHTGKIADVRDGYERRSPPRRR